MTTALLHPDGEMPRRSAGEPTSWWSEWSALETFIVVQYISTGLLFIPGVQPFRMLIRTLPYIISLYFLVTVDGKRGTPAPPSGTSFVLFALLFLSLSLARADTQPLSGIAQVTLQACIAAPILWVGRRVRSVEHVESLLKLILFCNALSAVVGLLQVYYPDTFLPTEFNRTALSQNVKLLTSLSYSGVDGRVIIRPPGLTDLPGGAAVAGMLCALLGISFAAQPNTRGTARSIYFAIAGVGFAILFLTQVRSLLMMTVVSLGVFAALAVAQRRPLAAVYIASFGTVLLIGAFVFAMTLGGDAIEDRFLSITERGAIESYRAERGGFLAYTFNDLLPKYPFGAGVGRWGVMSVYFGDGTNPRSPLLYAEIQLTGWLYDGGVVMWFLYGGAIASSIWHAFRLARQRTESVLGYVAAVVLCAQLMIAGMSMAGPAFNTQLGIQFWTLAAALHAAQWRDASRLRLRTAPASLSVSATAAVG